MLAKLSARMVMLSHLVNLYEDVFLVIRRTKQIIGLNTNNMDKVKEKIISLVPEITALNFGVQGVWHKPASERTKEKDISATVIDPASLGTAIDIYTNERKLNTIHRTHTIFPSDFTATGRPITLADVLRAIQIVNLPFHQEVIFGTREVQKFIGMWNLFKDYDNQTQKVKNFIGKLIGAV